MEEERLSLLCWLSSLEEWLPLRLRPCLLLPLRLRSRLLLPLRLRPCLLLPLRLRPCLLLLLRERLGLWLLRLRSLLGLRLLLLLGERIFFLRGGLRGAPAAAKGVKLLSPCPKVSDLGSGGGRWPVISPSAIVRAVAEGSRLGGGGGIIFASFLFAAERAGFSHVEECSRVAAAPRARLTSVDHCLATFIGTGGGRGREVGV